MKCRVCKDLAVVSLQSHNTAFCANCFLKFFSKQVRHGIEMLKLFTREDRILVALSGGKDSLALMKVLADEGYDVTALHLDLGIQNSSLKARQIVENFCAEHNFKLHIIELAKEGLSIDVVKKKLRRPICSACGTIKRYYFNKFAYDANYTVLATGHNLDDEVSRLLSNTLRWDPSYLAKQSPLLLGEQNFVRKVKPFWRLTEFETANYAFLQGIETHYAPCPYSQNASFPILKSIMQSLEQAMPGRKIDFYQGFLKRGQPCFAKTLAEAPKIHMQCQNCGYPTTDTLCSVCKIKNLLSANNAK